MFIHRFTLGELLELQWCEIDLKKGLLSVSRSDHYGKDDNGEYKIITGTPKTHNSLRDIPILKQLMHCLKEMKKGNRECVINRIGKYITSMAYQYEFAALPKKLNVPCRGFHSLRHMFATRAIECGIDVKNFI